MEDEEGKVGSIYHNDRELEIIPIYQSHISIKSTILIGVPLLSSMTTGYSD